VYARPIPTANDNQVRALLARYNCPVPYHAVRTRFLGSIASPSLSASPFSTVQGLWDGRWPALESVEAINELVGPLINGLWNSLTRHQNHSEPFRLIPLPILATVSNLRTHTLTRQQELDGFIEGLFNGADDLALSSGAARAVERLADARMTLAGIQALASDQETRGGQDNLLIAARHAQQMTSVLEHEIHTAVIECTRARRIRLHATSFAGKPH
jgi:hypothetical protein